MLTKEQKRVQFEALRQDIDGVQTLFLLENVGLNVNAVNEAYFNKEVAPHVADAWIDPSKCDARDEEIGVIGYEIPFNRHFYVYKPPRDLAEIDKELDQVSDEIMQLLREVHS